MKYKKSELFRKQISENYRNKAKYVKNGRDSEKGYGAKHQRRGRHQKLSIENLLLQHWSICENTALMLILQTL